MNFDQNQSVLNIVPYFQGIREVKSVTSNMNQTGQSASMSVR